MFSPQHLTIPLVVSAQEKLAPAASDAKPVPVTGTGVRLADVELFPSTPELPFPQHLAVPSERTEQAWLAPVAELTAPLKPETRTGVLLLVFVLSPN